MNPTQDIPQGIAPTAPEQPADKPASGIAASPVEKQTPAKAASDGVPVGLAVGTGLLLSAFLIFWLGLNLPNHLALHTLVASFGTFALMWVFFRLRIFQRPHGGMIVAGAIALFAATLPFAEHGFQILDRAAKNGLASEPAKPESEPADTLPVPTRQKMPPPPEAPAPSVPAPPAPPEDEIVRELVAPALSPNVGKVMRVVQDAKVSIGGHKYRIAAGSQFPYTKFENGTVTFKAGDQEVTIDSEFVTFTGRSMESPVEIARLAGEELGRRYPALADKKSPEREILDNRIIELRVVEPELFKEPHWPLTVGERIAQEEGWKRADQPTDENASPTKAALPPANEPVAPEPTAPAAPPNPLIPAIPPNVPQESSK